MQILKPSSMWDLKFMTAHEYSAPTIAAGGNAVIFTGVANKRQYICGFTLYALTATVATIQSTSGVTMWQFNLALNTQFTLSFDFMPVRNVNRGDGLRLVHATGANVSFAVTVWGIIGE